MTKTYEVELVTASYFLNSTSLLLLRGERNFPKSRMNQVRSGERPREQGGGGDAEGERNAGETKKERAKKRTRRRHVAVSRFFENFPAKLELGRSAAQQLHAQSLRLGELLFAADLLHLLGSLGGRLILSRGHLCPPSSNCPRGLSAD